jgi:hypothetical protein
MLCVVEDHMDLVRDASSGCLNRPNRDHGNMFSTRTLPLGEGLWQLGGRKARGSADIDNPISKSHRQHKQSAIIKNNFD